MKPITSLVLGAVAALAFTACVQNAEPPRANTANMNTNANAVTTTTAAPPSKEALMAMDKNALEAWKTKDTKFWDTFLAANFVAFEPSGRLDRAAAMKQYSGADCDVKSYAISDDRMVQLGDDAAVVVYKVAYDGTCGGQKLPPSVWSASGYVRDGDQWKGVFHAETPVTDPNAPPAKSSAPASTAAKPAETAPDAFTNSLMAVETKAWDAWKARDAKAGEQVMAGNFTSLAGSGPRDRAGSLKAWFESKCEDLAYTMHDPKAVTLSKDSALVTYHVDEKGTCDGRPNPTSLWVASFDVKEGDTWKNAFYMEVPQ